MQIDFARFPEIPQGSYSQSTADPDVLYVFFDEKQTDGTVKRLDVGEIRQGVFTFASSWKAHAAQAEISGRIKDLARVDSTPEDSIGIDMYDLFSEPMAAVKPAVSAPARTTENSLLDLRPVLAALWLTAMAGKPGCEDAARFLSEQSAFLSKLTQTTNESAATAETIREVLMLFKPAAFQQTLLKVLMDCIRPADGSTAAPLTWHAREAVLETTLSLGGLFASGVSLTGTLLAPHVCCSKKEASAALAEGADWVVSVTDAAKQKTLSRAFEKTPQNARIAQTIAAGEEHYSADLVPGRLFTKTLLKAWPGLSEGSLIRLVPEADSNNAVFFLTSLPPTATTILRLKALVSRTPAPDTTASVFFLSEVVRGTNAAAVLNGEAVEKLAAAVTRNDNSRRKNAGNAVSSAADLARLYRDPAEALRAAALYLNLA